MKKIIFYAIVFSVSCFVATAQEFKLVNAEGCPIEYRVIDPVGKKVEVAKAKGKKNVDLVIPDYVTHNGAEYIVAGIGKKACMRAKAKKIILPNTIKYIGWFAFAYSKNLQDFYFPEGLEVIDDYSFVNTNKLNHISIPSSVQYLGIDAFSYLSLMYYPEQYSIYNLPSIVTPDNCEYCGIAKKSVVSYYMRNPEKKNEPVYYNSVSQYIPSIEERESRESKKETAKIIGAALSGGMTALADYVRQTGGTSVPTSVGGMNNTSYSSDYLTSPAYLAEVQARANQINANVVAHLQQGLQQMEAQLQKDLKNYLDMLGEQNAWCIKFKSENGREPTELEKDGWVRLNHPEIYQLYLSGKAAMYEQSLGLSESSTTEDHSYDNSGYEKIKREAVEKLKEMLPSEKECDMCLGSGKCSKCNGDGWVPEFGMQKAGPCPVCFNHDGKCRWCLGKKTRMRK